MAVPGTKPKPRNQIRHRVPPVHEWVEIPDVPFENAPPLPRSPSKPWPAATKRWWHAISRMPHAVRWTETEWQFAFDTACLVASFHRGTYQLAQEIRIREKLMGNTADARRDLRIRYVSADAEADLVAENPSVTAMDDYRRSVGG